MGKDKYYETLEKRAEKYRVGAKDGSHPSDGGITFGYYRLQDLKKRENALKKIHYE